MTAILRWGTALLSLLLLTSVSHGYYWVTSAFKTPFPQAPDTRSGGYYLMDAYGNLSGPHYYLVPPCRPGGGLLPGPIGQAIMAGNLPHDLLMNKAGMSLGNAPMLPKQGMFQKQQPPTGAPPQQQQQQAMGQPPMLGSSAMQQFGMMQTPNQAGQYAMPYANAMPHQGMQAPMSYGPKPMMWAPYPGQAQPPYPGQAQPPYPGQAQPPYPYPMPMPMPQPGPRAMYWQAPNGIWQVQNAPGPNGGPVPFTTIPGFKPGGAPPPGFQPGQPMPMPPQGIGMMPPNMSGGPGFNPMQQFSPMQPMQPMQPFDPLQAPRPPYPQFDQMQLPRMDPMPPAPPRVGGSAYPVHPFTRSPRDFFMWGEVMEQERARANRPFPVP